MAVMMADDGAGIVEDLEIVEDFEIDDLLGGEGEDASAGLTWGASSTDTVEVDREDTAPAPAPTLMHKDAKRKGSKKKRMKSKKRDSTFSSSSDLAPTEHSDLPASDGDSKVGAPVPQADSEPGTPAAGGYSGHLPSAPGALSPEAEEPLGEDGGGEEDAPDTPERLGDDDDAGDEVLAFDAECASIKEDPPAEHTVPPSPLELLGDDDDDESAEVGGVDPERLGDDDDDAGDEVLAFDAECASIKEDPPAEHTVPPSPLEMLGDDDDDDESAEVGGVDQVLAFSDADSVPSKGGSCRSCAPLKSQEGLGDGDVGSGGGSPQRQGAASESEGEDEYEDDTIAFSDESLESIGGGGRDRDPPEAAPHDTASRQASSDGYADDFPVPEEAAAIFGAGEELDIQDPTITQQLEASGRLPPAEDAESEISEDIDTSPYTESGSPQPEPQLGMTPEPSPCAAPAPQVADEGDEIMMMLDEITEEDPPGRSPMSDKSVRFEDADGPVKSPGLSPKKVPAYMRSTSARNMALSSERDAKGGFEGHLRGGGGSSPPKKSARPNSVSVLTKVFVAARLLRKTASFKQKKNDTAASPPSLKPAPPAERRGLKVSSRKRGLPSWESHPAVLRRLQVLHEQKEREQSAELERERRERALERKAARAQREHNERIRRLQREEEERHQHLVAEFQEAYGEGGCKGYTPHPPAASQHPTSPALVPPRCIAMPKWKTEPKVVTHGRVSYEKPHGLSASVGPRRPHLPRIYRKALAAEQQMSAVKSWH